MATTRNVILADRQDITRAGLMYVLAGFADVDITYADDKAALIHIIPPDIQTTA